MKSIGMLVLVLGIMAMAYGGFSYTRESTALQVGPVQLTVKEKERVNIPLWAGVAATLAGGLMLVLGARKS